MPAQDVSLNGLALRPIQPADDAFLMTLYASTRADELAQVPWSADQKAGFCRMQFLAQHEHYQKNYTGSAFDVIEQEGIPVGRLYVARWEREIRIIDIALLPEYRGQGIGTHFLTKLQDEARESAKSLSIHVERFNPALALYQRLGFRMIEDKGVYLLMEWKL